MATRSSEAGRFQNLPAHMMGMSTNTSASPSFNRSRSPKGVPTGGQFASESKPEPSSGLDAPSSRFDSSPDAITRSLYDTYRRHPFGDTDRNLRWKDPAAAQQYRELQEVVESRHPDPSETNPQIVSDRDARDRARAVLPNLPDDEFDYRWGRLEQAQAHFVMYATDDGGDLAINAGGDEQLVDSWGYDDDEEYAADLTVAYADLRFGMAWEAVQADREHARRVTSAHAKGLSA